MITTNKELPQPFNMIYGIDHKRLETEAEKVASTKKEGKHTYREVFYEFFRERQQFYIANMKSPKTLADIEGSNRLYVLADDLPYETIADKYIEDLAPGIVKRFKRALLEYNSLKTNEKSKRKKGLSHQRLKNIILYIDEVFYFAYDQGYLPKSFVDDIKLIEVRGEPQKSKTAVRNFFSKKEYDIFIETYDEHAYSYFQGNENILVHKLHKIEREVDPIATFRSVLYKAYFSILFYTGLRKNEARGLCWKDLISPTDDMPIYCLRIDKQYTDKSRKYLNQNQDFSRDPKTPCSIRLCYLHDNCSEDLNLLRQYLMVNSLFNVDNFIFHDFYVKNPKPIPETNIDRCFIKIKQLSRIEDESISLGAIERHITIHGLRHASCTMLLEKGMSKSAVASFLGHSNTKMIEDVYNHYIKPEDMQKDKLAENLKFFMV